MSEVTDLVMPVLQKIQADLAEVKRVQEEHSRRFEQIDQRFERVDNRFEDMEIYLADATRFSDRPPPLTPPRKGEGNWRRECPIPTTSSSSAPGPAGT
jgi:hypothetical protein